MAVADNISIFFTILGIIGITAIAAISVYFTVLYLPYYQDRISSPFVLTFLSAIIAFLVSSVYLSMIDVSASSVLQCYLIDAEKGRGSVRYASEKIRYFMTT